MSRTSSSSSISGVRVASEPLSNVYTVLLLVGVLALLAATIMIWVALERGYGTTFSITDEGKANSEASVKAKDKALNDQKAMQAKYKSDIASFPAQLGAAPLAPVAAPSAGTSTDTAAPAPTGGTTTGS